MKQISFYLKTAVDFDACLRAFREQCPEKPSAVLVSVFSGWPAAAVRILTARLRDALPTAIIVGSTTSGEIVSGAMSEHTTILNFMVFLETRVKVLPLDLSAMTPAEAAAVLREVCRPLNPMAGLELLMAVNDTRTYEFLDRLNEFPANLPVFGGVAGSTDNETPYVFVGDRVLREGIVVICFAGDALRIRVNTSQGWRPLGPWFQITAMKGDNVIARLDHQPASRVYQKYLMISQEDIGGENLLFPLSLERDGCRMLRLPDHVTAEGALVMSADCRLGEQVRLAFGDPGEILDASYEVRMDIMAFEPQAILLFNCVSRRVFLQEDTNQELWPFQLIAPNAGFYVKGEVGRKEGGPVTMLNMTMVSVAFREGSREASRPPQMPSPQPPKQLTSTMKLVQYLANFVAVTSAELETANRQLAELATVDRLTGLYNRGEIEIILQKELSDRRQEKAALSAIMLDLDNFKKINDTYGHAVGDQVLRWAGSVMKRNIRRSDAAGRWGGEEFLIVLPGTSLAGAVEIAERIRRDISSGFALPDGKRVTASLGVAEYARQGTYLDFYRALDETLYEAKHSGKDRVCTATGHGATDGGNPGKTG